MSCAVVFNMLHGVCRSELTFCSFPGKKNSLLLQKFQKDLNAGVFNTQENELLKQIIRQDREMVMMVERKQSVTGANSTPMSGNSIINSPAQPPFASIQFQQQPQSSPMTPMAPLTYSTSASIIPAARLAGSVAFSSPGNPAMSLQQPTLGGVMSPCSFTAGRTFQYGSPTASQLSLVPQLSAVAMQPQQASPQRNEVHSSLSRDVRHLSASQPSLPHETSLAIRQHQSSRESLASIQPAASPSPQTPSPAPQQSSIRATVPPRVALFRQMSSGALPPVRAAPSTVQHRDPMGSRRESAVLNSGAETEQDKMRFASNLWFCWFCWSSSPSFVYLLIFLNRKWFCFISMEVQKKKKKRRVFLFLPLTNLVDILYRLVPVLYSILGTAFLPFNVRMYIIQIYTCKFRIFGTAYPKKGGKTLV